MKKLQKRSSEDDFISTYEHTFYSGFDSPFKKVAKKYKRTFESDFNDLVTVIKGKLSFIGENPRLLPQADIISGLGSDIKLPIVKMRMHIKECREKSGRVIFLFDKDNKRIFFIDVYTKNDRENHDIHTIKDAYAEYCKCFPSNN